MKYVSVSDGLHIHTAPDNGFDNIMLDCMFIFPYADTFHLHKSYRGWERVDSTQIGFWAYPSARLGSGHSPQAGPR